MSCHKLLQSHLLHHFQFLISLVLIWLLVIFAIHRNQWPIQGRGSGGPPPIIFGLNWEPKDRKKFFKTGPPLISGSWWQPPPHLSEGLDQPLATDDRKLYQCQNIVLDNKTGPLAWDSIDAKKKKKKKGKKMKLFKKIANSIQPSPEVEVNSGGIYRNVKLCSPTLRGTVVLVFTKSVG